MITAMNPDQNIPRAQFPLRIPADTRAALDAYARGYGISVNEAILRLIDRALAYEIVYVRGLDAIKLRDDHGDIDQGPDQGANGVRQPAATPGQGV